LFSYQNRGPVQGAMVALKRSALAAVDAAGRGFGFARGGTLVGGMAAIDLAGQAIDQPRIVLAAALESLVTVADCTDQRREQDGCCDHRRADQRRHGRSGRRASGNRTVAPDLALL